MTTFVSLMYHNVCATPPVRRVWPGFERFSPSITSYFVDEETFSQQCQQIAECRSRLPETQITFDDGWRGTFEQAGPILARHDLSAVVFVTTDLIGLPAFADAAMLADSGRTFVIGSHARTHRLLPQLDDKTIREELTTSKSVLEEIVCYEVDQLAFPGGAYDRRVVDIAREVGYRTLYTSQVHRNFRPATTNRVGRVSIRQETSPSTFQRYLDGRFFPEQIRSTALSGIKHLLGQRGYAVVRSRLLAEESTHLEMINLTCATDGKPSCLVPSPAPELR